MFLAIILPLLQYVLALLALDTYSISRHQFVISALLSGIFIGIILFVWSPLKFLVNENTAAWLFPVIEELAKLLPVVILIWMRRIVFFIDAVIYGASVGCGFSMIENLFYIQFNDLTVNTIIFRSISTSLMHTGCTALMALSVFWAVYHYYYKHYKKMKISLFILVIPLVHIAYNYNVLPPNITFLILLILFPLLCIGISIYNEKVVSEWLCYEANSHIAMFTAIQEGTFYETEAGKYLLKSKNKISPKKFKRIENYIYYCLKFSIKAKGAAIAKETGFAHHFTKEEHLQNIKEYKHIKRLERKIGIAAISIVRPIIHIRHADRCSLRIYSR